MSDEIIQDVQQETAPVADSPSYQSEQSRENIYDAFKAMPDFQGQDDMNIAQSLYRSHTGMQEAQRQLQQYQQVVPYAQEYLRNQKEFSAWQASQAAAAQPRQPEAPKWWAPPEVKDTWKSYIVRDPQTGREVISPDAPFDAQNGLREYQNYTADFARKLVTDPEKTLQPFIEQIAQSKAQEMVQQHLGQFQANNYISSLEQQNADWLYDQNGQVSREGQAIQGYISQAAQIGIQGADARWQYATGMLQRDLLQMRYQQQQMQQPVQQPQYAPPMQPPAPPQAAEQNMQFLRERATRVPNRSAGTTEPRATRQRMSFEDRLKGQLVNDGVI